MYTGRIRLGGGGSSPSRLPRGAGPGAHGAPALLLVVTSRAWMCRSQRGPTSGNPREGREHRGGARAKWFTDAFCFTKKLWVVEAHLCSCVGLRAFFCRFAPICNSVGLLALCAMEIFKIIVRNVSLPMGDKSAKEAGRFFRERPNRCSFSIVNRRRVVRRTSSLLTAHGPAVTLSSARPSCPLSPSPPFASPPNQQRNRAARRPDLPMRSRKPRTRALPFAPRPSPKVTQHKTV